MLRYKTPEWELWLTCCVTRNQNESSDWHVVLQDTRMRALTAMLRHKTSEAEFGHSSTPTGGDGASCWVCSSTRAARQEAAVSSHGRHLVFGVDTKERLSVWEEDLGRTIGGSSSPAICCLSLGRQRNTWRWLIVIDRQDMRARPATSQAHSDYEPSRVGGLASRPASASRQKLSTSHTDTLTDTARTGVFFAHINLNIAISPVNILIFSPGQITRGNQKLLLVYHYHYRKNYLYN